MNRSIEPFPEWRLTRYFQGRQHLRHNQKGGGKPELKSIIDELEQKIQKFGGEKEKDTEEDATDHQAAPATSSSSSNNDNSSSSKAATRKKRGKLG